MAVAPFGKRVAILGGGVAGLTAAHELAERGFQVEVFEIRKIAGGKARSYKAKGEDTRLPVPGEHGFRFFPGFYKHVPDTMMRIPCDGGSVFDNLLTTDKTLVARSRDQAGRPGEDIAFPAQPPGTPVNLLRMAVSLFFTRRVLGFRTGELLYYARRLVTLLTSCKERRFGEYEYQDWLAFAGAEGRSDAYRKYCADGICRSCVACRADKMSTRTGGYILLQLLFDLVRPGVQANRVLNGPTNKKWIEPWLEHLRQIGVTFHTEAKVAAIHYDRTRRAIDHVTVSKVREVFDADGRITHEPAEAAGWPREVKADYYIVALPVELLEPNVATDGITRDAPLLTPEMKQDDRRLAQLGRLQTAWMNGIQFYLDRDAPVVRGHALYIDSQWSLTSISQGQFWPEVDLARYGGGAIRDVLSVDISDWETEGINHKRARDCTQKEIKQEVWDQLKTHLDDDRVKELEDVRIVDWSLDQAIHYPNPNDVQNADPLLINTVGSWDWRPEAVPGPEGIHNLFLAGDYVRTGTDLATMESANESARRAVNGILTAAGSRAKPCKIWPLSEPRVFSMFARHDRWRYRRGLPHNPHVAWLALYGVAPIFWMLHGAFVLYNWLVELARWPGNRLRRWRSRKR